MGRKFISDEREIHLSKVKSVDLTEQTRNYSEVLNLHFHLCGMELSMSRWIFTSTKQFTMNYISQTVLLITKQGGEALFGDFNIENAFYLFQAIE